MSIYYRYCHYNVNTNTAQDSCPFNSLYWHFLETHAAQLSMRMIYQGFERMPPEEKQAILQHAEQLLVNLEDL